MFERQKAWKYSALGLLAVLAVSLSIPQAAAHVTNSTQHMLQHIFSFVDGIEAKTDNLPSDPADQSLIDAQLESIQSDTDDIQSSLSSLSSGGAVPKFAHVKVSLDPEDGMVADNFDLLPDSGNMYSGIITGTIANLAGSTGNIAEIHCDNGGFENWEYLVRIQHDNVVPSNIVFSEVFTCPSLVFQVQDLNNGNEASGMQITANIQYIESTEVTEVAN